MDVGPPKGLSPVDKSFSLQWEKYQEAQVSNEKQILLDPDVLTDYPTQALLLTVLVSNLYQFWFLVSNIYVPDWYNQ